jgi:hypothetical protein
MWKETRSPRAPEYNRTGSEINPNVKYPVQTEAAMETPADHLSIGERNEMTVPRGPDTPAIGVFG